LEAEYNGKMAKELKKKEDQLAKEKIEVDKKAQIELKAKLLEI
jgi:hypothetical protein